MKKGIVFAVAIVAAASISLATIYNPPSGGGGLTSPVGVADGGSGATTAAGARTNYGLAIGTDVTRGGYTTTVTAAGTTVFTVSSTRVQFFTGSTTQIVTLPVTSTLYLGFPFLIENNSSGIVTVNSSGGNTVVAIPANTSYFVTCILVTGTSAASWDSEQISGYGPAPSDTDYDATGWDGVTTIAPSKNAVRDKFVSVDAAVASAANMANAALSQSATSPQCLFDHTVSVTTTHTDGTEDVLRSDVVALMINQGDKLKGLHSLQFVSSATAARRIKLYFQSTLIWDSGSLTLSLGGTFNLDITVYRADPTGSETGLARCVVAAASTSASTVPYVTITDISGVNWASPDLTMTGTASGTGASSGDIISKAATVSYIPASAVVN